MNGQHTDAGVALLADDEDALDEGSARVVDAVEYRLGESARIGSPGLEVRTLSWIIVAIPPVGAAIIVGALLREALA